MREVGLMGASDQQIARYARTEGLGLLTGDLGFSDVRNYPPSEHAGIVVLRTPGTSTASFTGELLESFLERVDIIRELPGKLAIVRPGLIRIRTN